MKIRKYFTPSELRGLVVFTLIIVGVVVYTNCGRYGHGGAEPYENVSDSMRAVIDTASVIPLDTLPAMPTTARKPRKKANKTPPQSTPRNPRTEKVN